MISQSMDFSQLKNTGLLVQNHLAKRIMPVISLLTLRGMPKVFPYVLVLTEYCENFIRFIILPWKFTHLILFSAVQ